jgi:hypothetical protein
MHDAALPTAPSRLRCASDARGLIEVLAIPLLFSGLVGCVIAGGGLIFISGAQDATPHEP